MLPVGVTSHGPVALARARLTSTPKAPQGLAVSPASRAIDLSSLQAGTSHALAPTFSVTCLQAGTFTLTVDHVVRPLGVGVVDLQAGNDGTSTKLAVSCVKGQ